MYDLVVCLVSRGTGKRVGLGFRAFVKFGSLLLLSMFVVGDKQGW